jgi:hypothetical protein
MIARLAQPQGEVNMSYRAVKVVLAGTAEPVGARNSVTAMRVGARNSVTSCDPRVFMDESAEPVVSDDLGFGVYRVGECPERACLFQSPGVGGVG